MNIQTRQTVTLRHVLPATVAVGKQYVLHILSVCLILSYPACNAHAPYCRLWPVRLYLIFPHFDTGGTIFEKKSYWTQNVCSDFLYNFFLKPVSF